MLLNNHTYYSFRFGTFSEEELLKQAQAFGYSHICLTDINNTSACLNFIRLAEKYNIKPIVGIDFRIGSKQLYIGLAKNNAGFKELNEFLSFHSHTKTKIPEVAPEFKDSIIIYPFEHVLELDKREFKPNEYIGVNQKELFKIRFSTYYEQKDRIVILQPVTFRNKRDFNIHRLFRAIDNNTLLSKLDKEEEANAEDKMLPKTDFLEKFKEFPFIIKNTEGIIEQCAVHFDFSKNRKHQNKNSFSGSEAKDVLLIKELCQKGLKYRYSTITSQIQSRLEKELKLIQQMNFLPFFLINWDIIRYAKSKGYYHIGRGSGANSMVAYLLGITDVDPIDLNLYFERFMNLYRENPPDFDIDFSWRDREDVTRYIFDTYGKKGQVALLATYNTFKRKGAIRELGKVFGIPNHEIEVLISGKYNHKKLDKLSQLTLRYAEYIHGMPNHLSIHAGGVLISEKPIHYFSSTDLPAKGFPTTHFDMVIAEDVGLFKYDILGQRGLGKIKDALQIIKQNRPEISNIDIHNVKPFLKDSNINAMISRAECMGCFYVESPAMRMLLKKLEVDNYLGLVAASSIIRPGVAKSGMMREYILRHKNPDQRKKAHPVLWDIMEDTYGIMVYQEDVIKVAHHYGGLNLGEADVLRRGMSGKYRSREEFLKVKQKFYANCKNKGEKSEVVQEIWRQIESFAGYAFAKGHSASYAVESYQSLYLKHYFPLEYMVATINNGGGFYRPEIYIHEARMLGATIHVPDINESYLETSIKGTEIYLGFNFLHGLQIKLIEQILIERKENGVFKSLDDFINRIQIGIEQLSVLIRINAFRFTGMNKRNLLWLAHLKLNFKPKPKQNLLFEPEQKQFEIPEMDIDPLQDAYDEIELLGFPLQSPFNFLKEPINYELRRSDMDKHINKTITIYGYLVTVKYTKTHKGDYMYFGTFLDISGHWIDTVHFPPVAKTFPFTGIGIYKLTGKVVEEFGFLTLEITQMEKMAYKQIS
jgi:DNA polymerase-3 subunit alpha